MITRDEFRALCAMQNMPGTTQRQLATLLGVSLGTANNIHRSLSTARLIENGTITARGIRELEPFKVDNAIIMAAGLSSRFAPVSYEKPKGLLTVRGEILIERQIKQLQEAGITDITVVVGYKKELFFYLEERFGVQIVVNPEFASRNNHASLYYARHLLGNSFICASDNYFTDNPFRQYMWKACYSAEYSAGPTKEWCLSTDNKDRIVAAQIGGADAWYMVGAAYFDRGFSERMREILEAEYSDPRTKDKLWEDIFLEHAGELDMEICRQQSGTHFEFDSIDDIKDFDPLFLENVDVAIFDNIAQVLGCEKSEIRDVYPLKQGLTNLSCHFTINSGEYVYRHPGVGTEKMIDRAAEQQALELAKQLGLDHTFIYQDPAKGWKISRFIPHCRELDPRSEEQLTQAMQLARKLHSSDAHISRDFDFFTEGKKYEKLLAKKGPIDVRDYQELRTQAVRVKKYAEADHAPICVTHNDFFGLNLLYDEAGTLNLIDWEYAGMGDYASDYGTFVVTSLLNDEEAERALAAYFGRTPTPKEHRHNFAYVGLAGWCWYVWALQKESEGDFVGDWLYTYYRYAKKYLARALALYEATA